MKWLELSVAVDHESVEAVAEVFARAGHNHGVVIEPAWLPNDAEPGEADAARPYLINPDEPMTLRTYLALDEHAPATRQRIAEALWHLGQLGTVGELSARTLDDEDWENVWKQYYHIQHIGERTVIVPSWQSYEPAPGNIVLSLDPGMAFGTGLHPTTRLCLSLLERFCAPGQRLLDVGTGSGILAIAAAKHAVSSVLARDIDMRAVEIARENSALNHVDQCIVVECGALVPEHEQYDVVVANIIAGVLIDGATALASALMPSGVLIASGILVEREHEVIAVFESAGLAIQERHQEDEWIALVCRLAE